MKNIHLIPTTKPSNLTTRAKTNDLMFSYKVFSPENGEVININQHIYITSDEEIKDNDWACHKHITKDKYQIVKCNNSNKESIQEHWNKIVLTTDQDLIADGIQAIDADFLEWFVKHPDCEEVDISKVMLCTYCGSNNCNNSKCKGYDDVPYYEVLFAKAKPKQETLTYTEAAKKEERIFNSTMMKQETLEEAAEKYADFSNDYVPAAFGGKFNETTKRDFIAGAKWQAERMYSEEDMEKYAQYYWQAGINNRYVNSLTPKEWFEQFKKK
jgi:hypothetical protein